MQGVCAVGSLLQFDARLLQPWSTIRGRHKRQGMAVWFPTSAACCIPCGAATLESEAASGPTHAAHQGRTAHHGQLAAF